MATIEALPHSSVARTARGMDLLDTPLLNKGTSVSRTSWGRSMPQPLSVSRQLGASSRKQLFAKWPARSSGLIAVGIEAQKDGVAPKLSEEELHQRVMETQRTPAYTALR